MALSLRTFRSYGKLGGGRGGRARAGGAPEQEGYRSMPGPMRDAGPPPLIGVTTYLEAARWGVWVREAALLPAPYVRAVERAGGVPVLLPPPPTAGPEAVVPPLAATGF